MTFPPPAESRAACTRVLGEVSRTFALTIPTLQEPLRTQIEIAYLLCRMADTIEDRPDLDEARRAALFGALRGFARDPRDAESLVSLWPPPGDAAGDLLFRHAADVGACFAPFPEPVREDVLRCLDEMIGGMAAFARRGSPPVREACESLDALERYCHHVAGTVGILITRLFSGELEPGWLDDERLEQGRRFGLGLQLTNVLKDRAPDRERGVSYVPFALLRGGTLSDMGMETLVWRALEHLGAGQAYVLAVPPDREDMRLFCEWALLLAIATLERVALRAEPPKVERALVAAIESRTRQAIRDDAALRALFAEGMDRLESALARHGNPVSTVPSSRNHP